MSCQHILCLLKLALLWVLVVLFMDGILKCFYFQILLKYLMKFFSNVLDCIRNNAWLTASSRLFYGEANNQVVFVEYALSFLFLLNNVSARLIFSILFSILFLESAILSGASIPVLSQVSRFHLIHFLFVFIKFSVMFMKLLLTSIYLWLCSLKPIHL